MMVLRGWGRGQAISPEGWLVSGLQLLCVANIQRDSSVPDQGTGGCPRRGDSLQMSTHKQAHHPASALSS